MNAFHFWFVTVSIANVQLLNANGISIMHAVVPLFSSLCSRVWRINCGPSSSAYFCHCSSSLGSLISSTIWVLPQRVGKICEASLRSNTMAPVEDIIIKLVGWIVLLHFSFPLALAWNLARFGRMRRLAPSTLHADNNISAPCNTHCTILLHLAH